MLSSSSKIWIFFLFALVFTQNVIAQTPVRVIDNKGTLKELTAGQGIGFTNAGATIKVSSLYDGVTLLLNGSNQIYAANTTAYWNANKLQGIDISTTAPGIGQVLGYDGLKWSPVSPSTYAWLLNGNSGISTPAIPPTYGTTSLGATENWIGTKEGRDFVVGTQNIERLRVKSDGSIGIGTATTTANTLLTINPTTDNFRNGISMSLSGASSTATGINISSGTSKANGLLVTNSSTAITDAFYGVGSVLSSINIVSGYLGYRNGSGVSYGLYGVNGTTIAGGYATSANTYAAFLQGRTVISSDGSPSSPVGVDLEIQNTTVGPGKPVTLSMRQTRQNTTSGTSLAKINFGDSYSTSDVPQAQIQAVRDATGGSSDLPTALTFSTTPDGFAAMTERMRISNAGNVGIGTTSPSTLLHINSSSSPAFRLVDGTQGVGKVLTSDASGNASWSGISSIGSISLSTGTTGIAPSWSVSPVSLGGSTQLNIPMASTSSVTAGVISNSDYTTFANKIGAVTATTPAAVSISGTTATILNTGAYWNANQLQGKNISTTPPTNGYILAYNSTTSQWEPTANSGSGWLLTGNAGTTPGPNFLGTTDDKDLVLKTNNTESGRLSVYQFSTSFGIGATAANSGTAIGKSANAAQNGIALGTSSSTGYQALAVGYSAAAAGQSSVALGDQTSASAYQSIAIGNLAQAQTHDQTIAIGVSANASGYQSTSLGSGAKATAQNSTAIGNGTIADNANTVILGSGANVGIGTSAPQNKLEITQGTDGHSGLRLTNLKSAALLGTDANGDVIAASAASVPISSLLAATTTNLIDNKNFAQTWTWNSLTTNNNGLTLSSSSVIPAGYSLLNLQGTGNAIGSILNVTSSSTGTIGSGLVNFSFTGAHSNNGLNITDATTTGNTVNVNATALTSGSGIFVNGGNGTNLTSGSLIEAIGNATSATSANGGNGLLYINNNATASSGVVAKIQSNNVTTGSGYIGLIMDASGNVGVNTKTPAFTAPSNNASTNPTTFGIDGTVNATNYTSPVQTFTNVNSSFSWDLSKGSNAKITLSGNVTTFTISNVKAGMYGTLIISQPASAYYTFPTSTANMPANSKIINGGGGLFSLTAASGATDVVCFFYDGSTFWWTIGNNYN